MERLERAIEVIQSTIEEDGGELLVKMKVNLNFDVFISVELRRMALMTLPVLAQGCERERGDGLGEYDGESWERECRGFRRRRRGG